MTRPGRRPAAARRVRWLYHFTDMRSGLLLATLPATGVALSEVLGGPAEGEATVPLTPHTLARDPFRATIPRRAVMWAERQEVERAGRVADSRVMWSGIVMRRKRQRGGRAMTLGMVTWEGYFRRRLIGTDRRHTQVDKHEILRDLLAQGTAQPALTGLLPEPPAWADPHTAHLADPVTPGGVLADRTYPASALKPVLEAAQELAASGSGFQWRLAPYRDTGGQFRVRLDVGTPRLGRVTPANVRWTDDDNDSRAGWLLDYGLTEDGSAVDNRVVALGAGTGPSQLRAEAANTAEHLHGYPLYERSLGSSTTDLLTQQSVDDHAAGALAAAAATEVQLTGVTVRGDLAPTLTSYTLGDDGTFDLAASTVGEPVRIIGQIIGRKINPPQAGSTERVTLDVQGHRAA